jgi:hypothetical protein
MPESIYLTTTAIDTPARPWATANLQRMVRAARAYRGRDFVLAERAGGADLVLFVDVAEHYLGDVLRSRAFRENEDRAYVYTINDAATPVLPGMYVDIAGPVRLPSFHVGAFYLRCFDNAALLPRDDNTKPKYLFSFVGNVKNSPEVRGRIVRLQHPDALLVDRSSGLRDDDVDYVQRLRESRFVICPKGLGPTSWRFYETMMASRVPVIVSDDWVPARELDWPSFSLQVRERDIESIPALCEEFSPRAEQMGRRAREEWERCCALETAFGWVGRRLRELRDARSTYAFDAKREFRRELAYRKQRLQYARWLTGRTLRAAHLLP